MKIIVISNPENFSGESELVNKLFKNGLEYFHVRKPSFSNEECENYINSISKEYHSKLIVHYHFSMLDKFKIKGLHFNESNIKFAEKYKNIHKSYSAHSFNEVLHLNKKMDYMFLSPVFDSISKEDYKANFDINEIKTFIESYRLGEKLVALGGVNENNIQKVIDTCFGGVALMGCIWKPAINESNIEKSIAVLQQINEIM
ncbi:MAG: hypothetical protein A2033_02745 [Bacteroidetes bacterium GWA2_31_9]|nr:MAG: hypothetical protein A2033_02745 [Bacteroidetes bacterium GWA2_31_9]